jgi:hypothetical protein
MKMPQIAPAFIKGIANTMAAKNQEAARALPDSKGGEVPKQLQTYRTEAYSYFTDPSNDSQLMYSAENWVRIKLLLETAGPVSVGTAAQIAPVLSGKGILLETGVPFETYLAKGTRFYITSQTVNRISVVIEPVPWLEQIDQDTIATNTGIRQAVVGVGKAIVEALRSISTGREIESMRLPAPAPQIPRTQLPRLTAGVLPRKTPR